MTRKSSGSQRDKRGRQPVRIGTRANNRVFMFNRDWSPAEVDRARIQLKEIFDSFMGWTDTANAIAASITKRANPVPVPIPDIALPTSPDALIAWRDYLARRMPSVPFAGLTQDQVNIIKAKEMKVLQSSADRLAIIENKEPSKAIATGGTLHEAMRKYDEYVKQQQHENFDRHSKIKQLIDRHEDVPLAMLNIDHCRKLIDYWRAKPPRHDGSGNYSAKRSREQLRELDLFFEHTHISSDFAWRIPDDLARLKRTVTKDKAKPIGKMSIELFSVEELKSLLNTGDLVEKLIVTWCLNTAHGAAELGRVTWDDLSLYQDHPWRSQGLDVDAGGDWMGFLRPKSDVLGWWRLWPETVALIEEWKPEAERLLGRKVKDTDRLILTEAGLPMYKDDSKNGQSKFAKVFNALRTAAKIETELPLGTLRNQLPDWITTTTQDAVSSSVALCHGIPHKQDKLLFAHYSNRPWKKLFEYQMMYREIIFGN